MYRVPIRALWPALVALSVCSAIALGSCGRNEAESARPVAPVHAPAARPTGAETTIAQAEPFPTLRPRTHWSDFDLTKQAVFQAEEDLFATAAAYPTEATRRPWPPTSSPLPEETGISTACTDTRTHTIRSCWGQQTGSILLGIESGFPIDDERQGVVLVGTIDFSIRDQEGANPETDDSYPTPNKTGGLTMIAIDLPHVTLRSDDGVIYVFNLDTRSYESSATPTATAISGATFPATGVLDDFNRADGVALGPHWQGNTGGYETRNGQLTGAGAPIYWSSSFGPEQEAFVRLAQIDPSAREIDLLLKAQGAGECNVLEVWYQPQRHSAQVVTCYGFGDWTQQGTDIPLTLADGDIFGARVDAAGRVTVYQNDVAVGSVQVQGWAFSAVGGQIGLWLIDQGSTRLDDFGGGAVVGTASP